MLLTVIIVVELHGEVDVVGKGVQILHKQEEFPDEQHRGSLGVLQCHLHLYIVVPVVFIKVISLSTHPCRPYIQNVTNATIVSPAKPQYVHLWSLLSVFEFKLVGLNNALKKNVLLNIDGLMVSQMLPTVRFL